MFSAQKYFDQIDQLFQANASSTDALAFKKHMPISFTFVKKQMINDSLIIFFKPVIQKNFLSKKQLAGPCVNALN